MLTDFNSGHQAARYNVGSQPPMRTPVPMRNPQPTPVSVATPAGPPIYPILLAICVAAGFGIESAAVYFRCFTDFSWFDDEGYVLLGIRALQQGSRLYDQIYTQYGPFYFLVQSAIYTALRAEVTHDAGRFIVIGFWLLTAILCAWCLFRLTRSWLLCAAGFFASIKILFFFTGSPGHPEELCIALVAAIAVTACYCGGGRNGLAMILFGVLLAGLALTKVNIGLYMAVGMSLGLCAASPAGRLRTVVYGVLSATGVLLPVVVMAPLLGSGWALRVSLLAVLSVAAAVVVAWRSDTPSFMTPRLWMLGIGVFLACAVLVIGRFLMAGTTVAAMLDMTVLQHRGFAKNWYMSFPVYTEAIPLLSFAAAMVWNRTEYFREPGPRLALQVSKGALGALWLAATLGEFVYGWKLPPTVVYNIGIPFCWMILANPGGVAEDDSKRFARTSLALLGAWAAIYPLPVGGAQIGFAVVLAMPIGCVFLDDARRALAAEGFLTAQRKRLCEIALAVTLAAVYLFDLNQSIRHYYRQTPLALPGAARIRLDSAQAADYVWMTRYLSQSCDAYFSMPGILSLYLWTKTESPTMWNVSDWYGLLDERRQAEMAQDFSRYRKMCIVYNPDLVEFWRRGQDLSGSVLARYIQNEFTAAASRDRYVILVRKPASGAQ
jgi:hypothetical protein